MAAAFFGLAVNLTTDAFETVETLEVVVLVVEEQTDEVIVGGKFSWGDSGKPSDAKGGYQLGCQQLASHIGPASCSATCPSACRRLLLDEPLKLKQI